jgi:hypothetical protein
MKWLTLFGFMSGMAVAETHDMGNMQMMSAGDAQIVVTINPEARVSAVLGASLPSPSPCSESTELKVNIVNQGRVTAPLRAKIVGDGAKLVTLHLAQEKLSGAPIDSRVLHINPLGNQPVDITIAFSVDDHVDDLGGRDRVHFLMRCLKSQ